MTRSFAIRLDARKYATVARLARRRRATLSEVVREALDGWIETVRTGGRQQAPYVAVADLVGTVDSQTRREAAAEARRITTKAPASRKATPGRAKRARSSRKAQAAARGRQGRRR